MVRWSVIKAEHVPHRFPALTESYSEAPVSDRMRGFSLRTTICDMQFGGEDKLRLPVGGPVFCPFYQGSELVEGPYPVRDKTHEVLPVDSTAPRVATLHAAKVDPPPFIRVEVDVPSSPPFTA